MNKKIIFFLLVAIIVWGFAGFWYYRGNIFSQDVLSLEITGPETAVLGEEIEYVVKYRNNSDYVLENPRLIFDLPDRSLNEDSKTRFVENLRNLSPGAEDVIIFRGRLLGGEDEVKTANATLSYSPHNLSVRYESRASLKTTIDLVPITFLFNAPPSVERGSEAAYVIDYRSSVDYPLENASVRLEKVDGFKVVSSNPNSLGSGEWKLPTLTKNSAGTITINGIVVKESAMDTLQLKARFGVWQNGSFVTLKDTSVSVAVTNPPVDTNSPTGTNPTGEIPPTTTP